MCVVSKSVISKSVISASVISATVLCLAIGTGAAFAQAPAPVASASPAAKTVKPKLSPDEKKKVSQECSAQANDKKLHGKDRRTFRSTCIRHGGVA